jgi:uncharacterized protein YkwD
MTEVRMRMTAFMSVILLVIGVGLISLAQPATGPQLALAAGDCTVPAGDESVDADESKMLSLINQYRSENGAPALTMSVTLNRAAAWMSRDQAQMGKMSHTDSLGRSLNRLADCGYTLYPAGENVAWGTGSFATAQSTFDGWRGSDGHNRNMLSPGFKAAGIARACAGSGCYWTLDLGGPVDAALSGGGTQTTGTGTSPTVVPTTVPNGVPTSIPGSTGNGPLVYLLQNGVLVPISLATATPTPTVTAIPVQPTATVTPTATPTSTSTSTAATLSVSPSTINSTIARGWLNGPITASIAAKSCPASKSWEIVYWDGPETDIVQAAGFCGSVDRYWANRSGRWYGFTSRDLQSSDSWKVLQGEAVFARMP